MVLQLAGKCLALDILHVQRSMGTAAPELTDSGSDLLRRSKFKRKSALIAYELMAFVEQVWNSA